MAQVSGTGPVSWRADRDDDGFRTYKVIYRVQATVDESPVRVMFASGLPSLGSGFAVPGYLGIDAWCWCRPEMSVTIDQEKQGDPAVYYLVECTFGNRWTTGQANRCNITPIGDPCLEPVKVNGSFGRAQWEARYDKDGNRVVTSANEPIVGALATFDYARPIVRIEQNVASLGLSTFSSMVNSVNIAPLWGLPARCIKLTNVSWERKYYGLCSVFYTRVFDFECDYYNHDMSGNIIGWDHEIFDSGSICLRGEWQTEVGENYGKYKLLSSITATSPATINNIPQSDLMAYKDMNHEHARVFLDGEGRPANVGLLSSSGESIGTSGPPASARLKFYRESNFLLLGIPTTL